MSEVNELPMLTPQNELSTAWISNPYIKAATSDNTRKAYRSDIRHYEKWGGKLPATSEMIARYLENFASKLNPRTLARRITAISHWHTYQEFADPTKHPLITKTLAGIARVHGRPKNKAPALTPYELLRIVLHLRSEDSLSAARDEALLQLGFFGAFRRSELVNLQIENITWEKDGLEILIPHSKTDPLHTGQYCVIPYGDADLCPIQALEQWQIKSGITNGPIFRRIYANKQIESRPLSPLSVNHILKQRAQAAGISHAEQLSSHSMRRGLATSAARAGAPLQTIMRHGRWKQVNTVMEYIEASERFSQNAARSVLQQMDKNK